VFLKVVNVSKSYKTGNTLVKALDDVSLSLEGGEICTIYGPSGSGKTTLLNIIGGIDNADSGSVLVDGQDITKLNSRGLTLYRRNKIGFIFQFFNLVNSLTVYENVLSTAYLSKEPLDVEEVLNKVGLMDKKNKYPYELSGGEQQRVAIARAVVKNPKLILCDEPTGALDYENAKKVLKLLEDINNSYKTTIIIITHNIAISRMSDVVVRLRSGRVMETFVNPSRISSEEVAW